MARKRTSGAPPHFRFTDILSFSFCQYTHQPSLRIHIKPKSFFRSRDRDVIKLLLILPSASCHCRVQTIIQHGCQSAELVFERAAESFRAECQWRYRAVSHIQFALLTMLLCSPFSLPFPGTSLWKAKLVSRYHCWFLATCAFRLPKTLKEQYSQPSIFLGDGDTFPNVILLYVYSG